MQPISPVVPGLEEHEIKIAESQDEYGTLPALPVDGHYLVTRWRLTWRERLTALVNGDIYLFIWNFGGAVQPVQLAIDEPQLTLKPSTVIPDAWHDDMSSSEAHAEALDDLQELQDRASTVTEVIP